MKVFKVGGFVRDTIMGIAPRDTDWVIVGATTDDIQNLLDSGYRKVGADFPIFIHPETNEEYALARDQFNNFSPNITLEEDLFSRDLTINAIAMDTDGNIIDPYGGVKDIKGGFLRNVSNSFPNDPLRAIRVARFVSKYPTFVVHPELREMVIGVVSELKNSNKSRIFNEISKVIKSENSELGIKFIVDYCNIFEIPMVQQPIKGLSELETFVLFFHKAVRLDYMELPVHYQQAINCINDIISLEIKNHADVVYFVDKYRLTHSTGIYSKLSNLSFGLLDYGKVMYVNLVANLIKGVDFSDLGGKITKSVVRNRKIEAVEEFFKGFI